MDSAATAHVGSPSFSRAVIAKRAAFAGWGSPDVARSIRLGLGAA
jgi:hypothetical protein